MLVDCNLLFELRGRNCRFDGVHSDVGHAGNESVLFNDITDGISEILNLLRLGRCHELGHPRLSLQKRLVRLLHGRVVFVWKEYAKLAEVHLANSLHAVRVRRRV